MTAKYWKQCREGFASATAFAPASVNERATIKLGIAMISSADGASSGSSLPLLLFVAKSDKNDLASPDEWTKCTTWGSEFIVFERNVATRAASTPPYESSAILIKTFISSGISNQLERGVATAVKSSYDSMTVLASSLLPWPSICNIESSVTWQSLTFSTLQCQVAELGCQPP